MTDKPALSPAARQALMACFATRGPRKGLLKSKPAAAFTAPLEYAAWQGAMLVCNPFKASIFGMMMLQRHPAALAVFEEVKAYFDARLALARVCDKDRAALEALGVW